MWNLERVLPLPGVLLILNFKCRGSIFACAMVSDRYTTVPEQLLCHGLGPEHLPHSSLG